MENKTIKIKITEEVEIKLEISTFSEDEDGVSIEKILYLDIRNVEKEIITFPVLLSKIGFLMGEAKRTWDEAALNLSVWKNKTKKEIRKDFTRQISSTLNTRRKYTEDEIENEMFSNPAFKILSMKVINAERKHNLMNSIYWAAKAKNDNLHGFAKVFSQRITEGEIEIDDFIGSSFNGINFV